MKKTKFKATCLVLAVMMVFATVPVMAVGDDYVADYESALGLCWQLGYCGDAYLIDIEAMNNQTWCCGRITGSSSNHGCNRCPNPITIRQWQCGRQSTTGHAVGCPYR